ncbi:ubiquitin carboxyl-terminal hydrolase 5 [Gamsiella multidivaricata]|uniref:ubiquitin carboxyl-terminal hydrolase 5 n=1 Tax=Gamsiella multidivaricata TaxID=101098 RepID=UPI00221FFD25|nr:ubiquitin carboxyl-terminal hydrolase 5 [Gamsiella multidivaricata]KAI7815889.1 ubiquitin carboxyl-terminal hydrolase 5 [Gamsiella multidivaricata]
MEDQIDVKLERTSPVEEKPPVPAEELHSVNDVEWITRKLIPILPDQEERACEIFQWDIKDWKALDKRMTGPEFEIGGYKWRILLFPQGNNVPEQVAVYLESAEPREQQDANWHICAQFALLMSNPNDPTVYVSHFAHHRFTVEEADWGFTRFTDIKKLEIPLDHRGLPLVDKGHTVITACVRVYNDPTGVLWHNFINYDSKAMTGYVGLKNQGATCYMNSLLQSLFFTNYFRKAVYDIPTADDEPSKSVSLALQRVFYQLATSNNSVGTTELTRSFGWNSLESFMQHDVQEFNRVLQDNLEGKMKGTAAEGAIQKLFVGKMKSYIKCINVDYESSRVENFYDIQLNVKGCKTLRDSFANYIDVETLDGENKYQAEGHGLQDARKGVIFETLPPVLHLQLKRFEYDIERDAMVKINDRHEFPLNVDLADFVAEGEEKQKAGPDGFKYTLHGVLVHSGDLHGGHYFALLKPERDGKWYKFDDDRVTIATMKEVLDENYGGGEPLENLTGMTVAMRQMNRHKRFTNAYMLVYIRDNAMDEVLKPLTPADTPEHLQRRLEDERIVLENKRKERDESLLYFSARVISDVDFAAHSGFDLFSPLLPNAGKTLKVRKLDTFATFREVVAKSYGRTEEQIRIWTLVKRQNDTVRTDLSIPDSDLNATMEFIKEKYGTRAQPDLKCYVEFIDQPSGSPNSKPAPFSNEVQNGSIMIFTKYYDPFSAKLEGVGKLYVQKTAKVGDIVPILNERKGFPANTPLKLFEEIKPTMIEPMKMKLTFHQSEIQGGDIIVFQKELTPKEANDLREQNAKASIPQYFDYIYNRVVVDFKPKNDEDGTLQTYSIELSKKSTYDQVAQKLSEKLGVDPLHIQFTSASSPSGLPKNTIRRATNLHLQEMLSPSYVHQAVSQNILYYEKLNISIVELESKRLVKVTWLGPTMKDESTHELLLLKTSTLSALVDALLQKVKLDPNGTQKLRTFGVFNGKPIKEYGPLDPISSIHDSLPIYVEQIPTDELDRKDDEQIIPCFHFQGDVSRTHSIPFRMVIKEGEPFSELKARIRARLGMNEKDFSKVKFILYQSTNKISALNDDDILSDAELGPGDAIGLDHIDKSGRSNRLGLEKAITIRG